MSDQDSSPTPSYVLPSGSGALRAVSGEPSIEREMLRALLRGGTTVEYSPAGLQAVMPDLDAAAAMQLVDHLQRGRFVEFHDRPYRLGDNKVETVLPKLLTTLAGGGRGFLGDAQGFLISAVGYSQEQAARLAGLASELIGFDRRWRQHLDAGIGHRPPLWWSSGGAEGDSPVSTFILTLGQHRFVLVLEGEPQLDTPAFVWMVWSLSHRYDQPGPVDTD